MAKSLPTLPHPHGGHLVSGKPKLKETILTPSHSLIVTRSPKQNGAKQRTNTIGNAINEQATEIGRRELLETMRQRPAKRILNRPARQDEGTPR